MNNRILYIFEGEEPEGSIFNCISTLLLNNTGKVVCVYDCEIYQLYMHLFEDPDQDTFILLKEKCKNAHVLNEYNRESFSEIYFFFDYDGHATKADDHKVKELLEFFNEETEHGKLYISYPMVESLKHVMDYASFKNLEVKCKGQNCPTISECSEAIACKAEPHYKAKVGAEGKFIHIKKYDIDKWKVLMCSHLSKMNYIVNDQYQIPSKPESQLDIFNKQLEKHISKDCPKVAVLSAFPIFIFDVAGNEIDPNLLTLP